MSEYFIIRVENTVKFWRRDTWIKIIVRLGCKIIHSKVQVLSSKCTVVQERPLRFYLNSSLVCWCRFCCMDLRFWSNCAEAILFQVNLYNFLISTCGKCKNSEAAIKVAFVSSSLFVWLWLNSWIWAFWGHFGCHFNCYLSLWYMCLFVLSNEAFGRDEEAWG